MPTHGLELVQLDLASTAVPRHAPPPDNDTVGVLLHGFGASADDLVPLAPHLGTARRWLVPHAPAQLVAHGMHYGRAWFPRDAATMERALAGEYFTQRRALRPPGLTVAAREVRATLAERKLHPRTLIVGGFSQGAMVTVEYLRLALTGEWPLPRAALLFSGALIAESWWDQLERPDARAADCSIFQAHAHDDAVLPYDDARALAAILRRAGFPVTWLDTAGGHTIPQRAIDAAAQFLRRAVTA